MIESLTPQLLTVAMVVIVLLAPVLTLVLSALLLWRYRRAVRRAMAATVGFVAGVPTATAPVTSAPDAIGDLARVARRAAHWQLARYVLAGLGFALVLAVAAGFVFPSHLGVPGALVAVWFYLWPAWLAAPFLVRWSPWRWGLWFGGYFLVLGALGALAATVPNLPEYRLGTFHLAARSSVTPWTLARMWLLVNGPPTLLMALCLNRWIRAVAPLVLALTSVALVGWFAAYYLLYSPAGQRLAAWLGVALPWLVLGGMVAGPVVFALAGAGALRVVAARYREGRASDQSIQLDALWLLFAASDGLWLVLGGVGWGAVVVLACGVFKGLWWGLGRFLPRPPSPSAGLVFLRVFALGRRSDALLAAVAREWRHVGSIQLITGLDLAHSTVQPHQFLDFLARRLARHFVRDPASLAASLAECRRTPDPDGRYRINSFFCHADSWQAVLPHLVADGDRVLMDLRRFSPAHDGCVHELRFLVAQVPLQRAVLVVDGTTDEPFLDAVLTEALAQAASGSPNHGQGIAALGRVRWDRAADGVAGIFAHLARQAPAPAD